MREITGVENECCYCTNASQRTIISMPKRGCRNIYMRAGCVLLVSWWRRWKIKLLKIHASADAIIHRPLSLDAASFQNNVLIGRREQWLLGCFCSTDWLERWHQKVCWQFWKGLRTSMWVCQYLVGCRESFAWPNHQC